jgi:hypothetical protein
MMYSDMTSQVIVMHNNDTQGGKCLTCLLKSDNSGRRMA